MTKALPAGIRLQMLIKDHHKDILERERNNGKFIHLYNIGTYWVAFERSAFRVDNIFQGCEISLFMVSGYPEYVVMASVPHDEADDYFRKHIIHHDKPDYKVLSISPAALNGNYHRWHIQAVKKVLLYFDEKYNRKLECIGNCICWSAVSFVSLNFFYHVLWREI